MFSKMFSKDPLMFLVVVMILGIALSLTPMAISLMSDAPQTQQEQPAVVNTVTPDQTADTSGDTLDFTSPAVIIPIAFVVILGFTRIVIPLLAKPDNNPSYPPEF